MHMEGWEEQGDTRLPATSLGISMAAIDAHGWGQLLVGFLGRKPSTQAKHLQQQKGLKREKALAASCWESKWELQGPGMVTHPQRGECRWEAGTRTSPHPCGGDILSCGKGAEAAKRDSTELERGRSPVCRHRGSKLKLQAREQMEEKKTRSIGLKTKTQAAELGYLGLGPLQESGEPPQRCF